MFLSEEGMRETETCMERHTQRDIETKKDRVGDTRGATMCL